MLQNIPFPVLPAPPSWYPGHMTQFTRMLPAVLRRTDVVLELRDARLPLTSINRNFEGALRKWRHERGASQRTPRPPDMPPGQGAAPHVWGATCERIVIFNKRDLVAEWGIEPFRRAMATKYPDQQVVFASWNRQQDIKMLNNLLADIAKQNKYAPEMNVLVVGMPNVGKSTLLNALRSTGIAGPTAKALRTSAQPGMTRALSTRLKLSVDPLIYSYDTPGVMLPFMGRGDKGAERGVKLALIAGLKEGLYEVEALASYLLYRFNILDPTSPAYLTILPPGSGPVADLYDFLDLLAQRLGMLQKGGIPDHSRAAVWFVKWWREHGSLLSASAPLVTAKTAAHSNMHTHRRGWGFDFEWTISQSELPDYDATVVQQKMEECIDAFEAEAQEEERDGSGVSATQEKKKIRDELLAKRASRSKAKLAMRRSSR